jgi:peroxiredoxin
MAPEAAEQSLESQLAELRETSRASWTAERIQATDALIAELDRTVVAGAVDVGERAPDFTLRTAEDDGEINLSTELGVGPVILSFYRGQWCPYCNLELQAVQRRHGEILELGGQVFFVGPETRDNARTMMDKTHSSIPLLYDLDGEVMKAFRVEFTQPEDLRRAGAEPWNPRTGWRLPVPATYVINQDGIVAARFAAADYRHRPEPQLLLETLRQLRQNPAWTRQAASE